MQPWRITIAVTLLAAITLLASPYPALAQSESPPDGSALSPYWSPAVQRWDSLIVEHAQNRSLDPDLVAAVIWKESLGRAQSRGPVGAVGLMGLMPFDWRPPADELEQPWTNLFWGTRALAQTIRDGDGDLYYSLAAYNGSWQKAGQDNTRRYAASVLDLYTRAVAVEYGMSPDGDWIALLAVEGMLGPRTLTVLGPQRPLARYTERPLDVGSLAIPSDVPPHATVIAFKNGRDQECRVNLWLVSEDGAPLLAAASRASAARAREIAAETAQNSQGAEFHAQ